MALSLPTLTQQDFQRLIRRYFPDSTLVNSQALTGGASALVRALELKHSSGRTQIIVIRCHGAIDLKNNPQIATDEQRLLTILHDLGLPVPKPLFAENGANTLARSWLASEYLVGDTEPHSLSETQMLGAIADLLLDIHAIPVNSSSFTFAPRAPPLIDAWQEKSHHIGRYCAASALPSVTKSPGELTLLHGDFWPGNLLWHEGRISGVLDWEDFKLGPALADLANTRLELLWAFDIEAMQYFTECYQQASDINFDDLPFWDLLVAIEKRKKLSSWGLDQKTETDMFSRLDGFVERAITQLRSTGGS